MVLGDKIKNDLIAAMKAGDALRVSVLRMLISEMKYKQIDLHRELTDDDVIGAIQKQIKKRKEAIQAFQAGGRQEQAETEAKELEMLQAYLPAQMDEKEIAVEIEKIMMANKFVNFGEAMKVVTPQFKGRAEGGMVAKIVKELMIYGS